MTDHWPLILLAVVVLAVGLWWLLGKGKDKPDTSASSKTATPQSKPAVSVEPAPPAVLPPTAVSLDVAPPQTLVETQAVVEKATKAPPKPKAAQKPAAKTVAKPAAKAAPKSAPKSTVKAAEPTKAAPAPKPKPAAKPKAAAKPAPVVAAEPDNLLLLKGVGPKLATLLGTLGVTSFAQIAAWSDADIARIDDQLGTFKGRASRDKWVEQAGYLAKGDRDGFEAKFGKLEG
jgi:predicted flap endonuclease-1-like 5' DNA nuclease